MLKNPGQCWMDLIVGQEREHQSSIMISAVIYGDEPIGPYKFDDRVKLTSQCYFYFLGKTFFK